MSTLDPDKIGAQLYGYRDPLLTGVAELAFNGKIGYPTIQVNASLNFTPGIVVNLSPTSHPQMLSLLLA
jgi:hypothetical protein